MYPVWNGTSTFLAKRLVIEYLDKLRFCFHHLYLTHEINLEMSEDGVNCPLYSLSIASHYASSAEQPTQLAQWI